MISISGVLVSAVNPGPKKPPRWSRTSVSLVTGAPVMEIESVFVTVAAPHGAGT